MLTSLAWIRKLRTLAVMSLKQLPTRFRTCLYLSTRYGPFAESYICAKVFAQDLCFHDTFTTVKIPMPLGQSRAEKAEWLLRLWGESHCSNLEPICSNNEVLSIGFLSKGRVHLCVQSNIASHRLLESGSSFRPLVLIWCPNPSRNSSLGIDRLRRAPR